MNKYLYLIALIGSSSSLAGAQDLKALADNSAHKKSSVISRFTPFRHTKFNPRLLSAPGGKSIIEFVGDGNLQKSLNQGDKFAANTGLGVIFSRRWGADTPKGSKNINIIQNIELNAFINVASTADSILGTTRPDTSIANRRQFGSYLLLPLNSGQASHLNFDVFFGYGDANPIWEAIAKVISGVNFRYTGSNSNWIFNGQRSSVSAISYRYGIFHEFLSDDDRFNDEDDVRINYSVIVGIYRSSRLLRGDLGAETNDGLRRTILGSPERNFRGWDLGLTLRLKNIRAEVLIPIIKGKSDQTAIPGLTNTQLVTSISFVGGFPIKLGNNNANSEAEAARKAAK